MVEKLKKQVSDLKLKNQQLDSENRELSQKNSQNKEELKTLNQRLAEMLCQKEEPGTCTSEKWEQENESLKEELDRYKVQTSTLVSSLEAELSEVKLQTHIVEQENLLLRDELERLKQVSLWCRSGVLMRCLQPPNPLCTMATPPAYCFRLMT